MHVVVWPDFVHSVARDSIDDEFATGQKLLHHHPIIRLTECIRAMSHVVECAAQIMQSVTFEAAVPAG